MEKSLSMQACPVCHGHGIIPEDFYIAVLGRLADNTSISPETCKNCHGSGIIYTPKENKTDSDNE